MSVGSFISREFKFGEAAAIAAAANNLNAGAPALEAEAQALVPQTASALISAVNGLVIHVLGPINGATVVAILAVYNTQITAELEAALNLANPLVAQVAAAMSALAAKLQAEALATK